MVIVLVVGDSAVMKGELVGIEDKERTYDSMAIYMAFQSSQLEVLGLTTIFGNVTTKDATRNALLLDSVRLIQVFLYVAEGTLEPLKDDAVKNLVTKLHSAKVKLDLRRDILISLLYTLVILYTSISPGNDVVDEVKTLVKLQAISFYCCHLHNLAFLINTHLLLLNSPPSPLFFAST
ncbi:Uridine nucleosidase 1 [Camellia lanceoleosa]|uniref:Uridine nucleosidase 1 n=1 Tax=Camellia lanceoleosa TaxID=1840588 RepID=A0ACC0IIP4_9ERIC|nr:Uridine nucleosidase 1 [Camellia lanceoleosa]